MREIDWERVGHLSLNAIGHLLSGLIARLPFAPINNIAQTFAHPQALARQVYQEVEVGQCSLSRKAWIIADHQHPRVGRIKLASPAVSYDGEKPKVRILCLCQNRFIGRGRWTRLTRTDLPGTAVSWPAYSGGFERVGLR